MIKLGKKSDKTILGLNTGHDGGACLLRGDTLVAISEERLNRNKQSYGYMNAIQYCLEALDCSLSEVDVIAFSSYHDRLPNNYEGNLKNFDVSSKILTVIDHHISHAYGGYYLSPFDEAIIVVIDGLGNEKETESYYYAKGISINKLGSNSYERSIYQGIGRAYEAFTNYIGWRTSSAGKTMGLAAYGKFEGNNLDLYSINEQYQVSANIEGKYGQGVDAFFSNYGLDELKELKGKKEKAADIASFIQYHTTEIICKLVSELVKKTGVRNLVLAGGVALNCIANQELLNRKIVDSIFVPPFPCDTGQCIGNVLAAAAENGIYVKEEIPNAYLARSYTSQEIEDVLYKKQKIFPLPYEIKKENYKIEKICDENEYCKKIANAISLNKIVGWFQGASEIGPRALGARSILANPCNPDIRDHINQNVKKREKYRPFAASIAVEDVGTYFCSGEQSRFMSFTVKCHSGVENMIPSALHVDKTSRIQAVSKKENPKYYNLIKEMKNWTSHPLVLNTSFNEDKEPIVESPVDALRHLAVSNIDVLAIENYIVTRE